MSTFIERLDIGAGIPVAIKDLIDVAGVPTTSGCRALADTGRPAEADAPCLAEIRRRMDAGEVRIVGKTNLHELAFGTTGVNEWFGTPRNPLDPELIPGGSSSGSAVAVADGDADVALGTDTGGSVRIPAACCGVAGLKTTWGRISLDGVRPLAASLDTVGPLARDVASLVTGMQLLEPGFAPLTSPPAALKVSRVRVAADPVVDQAVDAALATSGLPTRAIEDPGWSKAWADADVVLSAEAWRVNRDLVRDHPSGVSRIVTDRVIAGGSITDGQEQAARAARAGWQQRLLALMRGDTILALPTLEKLPPRLDVERYPGNRLTLPLNFAGFPALSIPVPTTGRLPASLQLVAPPGGEELLLAAGAVVESALLS